MWKKSGGRPPLGGAEAVDVQPWGEGCTPALNPKGALVLVSPVVDRVATAPNWANSEFPLIHPRRPCVPAQPTMWRV